MLKPILKYIGQLKTAEQRLIVLLLLNAVIVLSGLLVKQINSDSKSDKNKITLLENKYDSLQRADQKKLDACQDQNFSDKLDKIAELEKYNHRQDSLIDRLRKIK